MTIVLRYQRRFLLLIVLQGLYSAVSAQQSVQFTQYMFNGLAINPAYAGADQALSVTLVQRRQWSGVDGAPVTHTLSAHSLFKTRRIGLGVLLVNDKIGVHKNLSALSNVAYHLEVKPGSFLSFGLSAGIRHHRADFNSLVNASPDPRVASMPIASTVLQLGTGIYYRSDAFHVGLSVPELTAPSQKANDSVRTKYQGKTLLLFSKISVPLSRAIEFQPVVLVKYFAGIPFSFDIGVNTVVDKVLTIGVSYRKRESLDALIMTQVTPQLQFGYSYDHPAGSLVRYRAPSHELMVQYLFSFKNAKVVSPR